jgi:superfamily II DNA or RNA helicase
MSSAISHLQFPFSLKRDQLEAVDSWVNNNFRGTVLYSSGTGKTEIAFECASRAARGTSISQAATSNNRSQRPDSHDSLTAVDRSFNILYLVPRIVLIDQNVRDYWPTTYQEKK